MIATLSFSVQVVTATTQITTFSKSLVTTTSLIIRHI